MWVSELFYSIQGEGILAGVPSVFIRLSGCNLRCRWCDTPYTSWNAEGEHMPLEDVLQYVRTHSTGHTVITGGEPAVHPDLPALTSALAALGQHITIETAGTVYVPVDCHLASTSPKLANSTPDGEWHDRHEALRYRPDVIRQWMSGREYQLKFVVQSESDLEEIAAVAAEVGAPPSRVLLMPEGVTPDALAARSAWISEACKRTGYRYSPRLHVLLYGSRRGV